MQPMMIAVLLVAACHLQTTAGDETFLGDECYGDDNNCYTEHAVCETIGKGAECVCDDGFLESNHECVAVTTTNPTTESTVADTTTATASPTTESDVADTTTATASPTTESDDGGASAISPSVVTLMVAMGMTFNFLLRMRN